MEEVAQSPESTQPARSYEVRLHGLPEDVYLAIKHAVVELRAQHPGRMVGQTDFIALLVRDWVGRGGPLTDPEQGERPA